MKVAELNDGESVESLRQVWRLNAIVPYVDLCRVANASPIKARRHEEGADQDMRQSQILDVKEVYALAEDLRLMVLLDPEALPRVPPPDTLLKDCQNILVRHGLRESFWVGAGLAKRGLNCKAFFRKRVGW
jgi:hypothetical protein